MRKIILPILISIFSMSTMGSAAVTETDSGASTSSTTSTGGSNTDTSGGMTYPGSKTRVQREKELKKGRRAKSDARVGTDSNPSVRPSPSPSSNY